MGDAARVAELRSALETKQAFIQEGASKGIKIDGDKVEVSKDSADAIRKAMSDVDEIKMLIRAENMDAEIKSFFEGLEAPSAPSAAVAAAAAAAATSTVEPRDLGTRFTKSEIFQNFQKSGKVTMDEPFKVEGERDIIGSSGYGQKDIWTGTLTGATNPNGFGRVQFDAAVPRPFRTARVRDLFPVATTNANLIDYFRVLGFATGTDKRGNAATVADYDTGGSVFGLKPKSQLQFESAQAPVRTIAHWEAAHRNVIMDEPQLQSTINNELLYGLALAEDDQILNGNGVGENLRGITQTPGIQSYLQSSGPASDRKSDALRRAATLVMLANFPATGFVLHPFDWEDIELQKATGDGQYMLVTNFAVGANTTIWRQPVIETPAMTETRFLTGAWGLGAQLYDRMQANIRIAEQHADFFVRNAVAILAEERLALAVKRPEAFVYGTFAPAT